MQECIGAIDGTYISAWAFLDALTRKEVNFPWPSEGKYYLVLLILVHLDFCQHIEVSDIIYKNIGVDVINPLGINNFLTIDTHSFGILLKDFLVF